MKQNVTIPHEGYAASSWLPAAWQRVLEWFFAGVALTRAAYYVCFLPPGGDEVRLFGELLRIGFKAIKLAEPATHPLASLLGLASIKIFGPSLLAVTLPTLLTVVVLFVLLHTLCSHFASPAVRLLLFASLALNPSFLIFASSMKGYILSMVVVAGLLLFFRKVEIGTWKQADLLLLGLLVASTPFIHTVVAFATACALIALAIWAIFNFRNMGAAKKRWCIQIGLVSTACALPFALIVLGQLKTIIQRDSGDGRMRFQIVHILRGMFGWSEKWQVFSLVILLFFAAILLVRHPPKKFPSPCKLFLPVFFFLLLPAFYWFKIKYFGGRFILFSTPLIILFAMQFVLDRTKGVYRTGIYFWGIFTFCILPAFGDPAKFNWIPAGVPRAMAFLENVKSLTGTSQLSCFSMEGDRMFAKDIGHIMMIDGQTTKELCRDKYTVVINRILDQEPFLLDPQFQYELLKADKWGNKLYLRKVSSQATFHVTPPSDFKGYGILNE